MQAKLIRIEETQEGTIGALTMDGKHIAMTLELADRENRAEVSCIPAGRYVCQRVHSPTFGRTFEVKNVPDRTHILFHKGNTDADTHGCVLLGEKTGKLRDDRAVLNSGKTFQDFLELTETTERFDLLIIDETEGY